jgi:2,3-dihydro-2,3-dihydroxybenzoate dehydrogenase
MFDKVFSGQVALVTGAGGGIGREVVHRLAEYGAVVAAVDRDLETLRATAAHIVGSGATVDPVVADVASSVAVEVAVADVEERLGPIKYLVNGAGVLRLGPSLELTDEDWRQTFTVNTEGVFYVSRAVARRMAARRDGAIVTIASNAARVPRAHMAAYGASKAAAAYFTKTLALELAGQGIRCNVVEPGSTDTPMLRAMWTDDQGLRRTLSGDAGEYRLGIPLGKLAQPSDVADAVVFLLSDMAGHITMHELCVDGGAALGA